jgi:hypothetical protein
MGLRTYSSRDAYCSEHDSDKVTFAFYYTTEWAFGPGKIRANSITADYIRTIIKTDCNSQAKSRHKPDSEANGNTRTATLFEGMHNERGSKGTYAASLRL